MIIRQALMTFLSQVSRSKFEDSVAEHLKRCFPAECETLGTHGVQQTISYGVERAASHGIVLERDVCKYIDLMFVFGRNYDTDKCILGHLSF